MIELLGTLTDDQREILTESVVENLTDVYHCTRVWSAWEYGTMTDSDFVNASESDLPAEIIESVLKSLIGIIKDAK